MMKSLTNLIHFGKEIGYIFRIFHFYINRKASSKQEKESIVTSTIFFIDIFFIGAACISPSKVLRENCIYHIT